MSANLRGPSLQLSILARVRQPTPAEVRAARERSGLTQAQAASIVSGAVKVPYRTWATYEAETASGRRAIPLPAWELFLLMTGQHPSLEVTSKTTTSSLEATSANEKSRAAIARPPEALPERHPPGRPALKT